MCSAIENGSPIGFYSATAFADIAAKAAKLPLYKLWGAVTDRVACYGSGGWGKYTEKDLLAEAERYAGMGCRCYKMKIHDPDPLANRKRVEMVKKALGAGVRMMVDVNQKLGREKTTIRAMNSAN